MTVFFTEAELAERLGGGADAAQVAKWRRYHGWPHVKLGREVRYTEADVEAIVAKHHKGGETPEAMPGQTALSAARSR